MTPVCELVKKIARMPRNANDRPNTPVKIIHIKIVRSGYRHGGALKPAAKACSKNRPKQHCFRRQGAVAQMIQFAGADAALSERTL